MYSEDDKFILNRMLANINDEIDKGEGSLIYDSLSPSSKEFSNAYSKLDDIIARLDIENLSGEELEKRIYQRTGIIRKSSTFAHKYVKIIGNSNIKIGDLFETPWGIQFKAIENKTIVNEGTVNIEAVISGSIGNIPVNQITKMPVIIPGVVSVTNPEATEGGYDAESDSSLLERYYERVKTPPTSGNKAQYKSWAKEVTGVGDAMVYPTWNGDNTVKVVIIDSNRNPATSELVTVVQNYIDPGITGRGEGIAPIGAKCTVESATGKSINISFTALKDSAYTNEQRQANFEKAFEEYLKSIVYKESSISYTKIGALIISTQGFLDYSNLTVNGGTANIPLSYKASLTEIPVKGEVTIV